MEPTSIILHCTRRAKQSRYLYLCALWALCQMAGISGCGPRSLTYSSEYLLGVGAPKVQIHLGDHPIYGSSDEATHYLANIIIDKLNVKMHHLVVQHEKTPSEHSSAPLRIAILIETRYGRKWNTKLARRILANIASGRGAYYYFASDILHNRPDAAHLPDYFFTLKTTPLPPSEIIECKLIDPATEAVAWEDEFEIR